jgi:hypothetical protein
MPESALTDFATRRFAADESYIAEDSGPGSRGNIDGIILSVLGRGVAQEDFAAGLTDAPDRATTIAGALAEREQIARR